MNLTVTYALLSLVDDVQGDHQLVIVVRWLAVQHPPHVFFQLQSIFCNQDNLAVVGEPLQTPQLTSRLGLVASKSWHV